MEKYTKCTPSVLTASIGLFLTGMIGLGLKSKLIFLGSFSALYVIFLKYGDLFRHQ